MIKLKSSTAICRNSLILWQNDVTLFTVDLFLRCERDVGWNIMDIHVLIIAGSPNYSIEISLLENIILL